MIHRYSTLASYFHLLTAPADYVEEAAWLVGAFRRHGDGRLETVLELGCGGGNLASHLPRELKLTLTDLSPEMLEVCATINPNAEHIAGDMRTLRLAREFDAVFAHDAICYMNSEADLAAAIATAFAHTRTGGVVILQPDDTRENFRPKTEHGGHDAPDGRGLRYLQWEWDPDPTDARTTVAMSYLVRGADGNVRTMHDVSEYGLFPRETWLRLLAEAGFVNAACERDDWERDVFIARKPRASA